jgi:hypothetical protein
MKHLLTSPEGLVMAVINTGAAYISVDTVRLPSPQDKDIAQAYINDLEDTYLNSSRSWNDILGIDEETRYENHTLDIGVEGARQGELK